MAYTISSFLAIYFVLWWVVLFVALPFGIRTQSEEGESAAGTDPGAPIATGMKTKMIWTTLVSTLIFAAGLAAFYAGYLNVERLTHMMGIPL